MKNPRSIGELFSFPGFIANAKLKGVSRDRFARVVVLRRRKKQVSAHAVDVGAEVVTIKNQNVRATLALLVGASTLNLNGGECPVQAVALCM